MKKHERTVMGSSSNGYSERDRSRTEESYVPSRLDTPNTSKQDKKELDIVRFAKGAYTVGMSVHSFFMPESLRSPLGFTTPYTGVADVLTAIAAPFIAPIAFAVLSAAAAVLAALAAVVCVGALIVAAFASPFEFLGSSTFASDTVDFVLSAASFALVAAAASAVFSVVSTVAAAIYGVGLLTRTVTSIADKLGSSSASRLVDEDSDLLPRQGMYS